MKTKNKNTDTWVQDLPFESQISSISH